MRFKLLALSLALAALPLGRAAGVEEANAAFRASVRATAEAQPLKAALIEQLWTELGPQSTAFVTDGLAVLHPEFHAALEDLDAANFAEAARKFDALRRSDDPFLATNAAYFHARSLMQQGLLEEALPRLNELVQNARLSELTPFAAHAWLARATCEANGLDFDAAANSLKRSRDEFPDAPEPVHIGASQLALELERRERGTLEEVATVMSYSAARLRVSDADEQTRARQDEVIALLDKMIKDAEDREKQQKSQSSASRGARGGSAPSAPRSPAQESEARPGGESDEMSLHGTEKADPGEMWGRMPPAEREKILQSLRNRFPSRYRQLVEQYYRSLAEEKP